MTSTPITAVTLTTSNIVDNQQIDAADVTVPFGEVQTNLPANAGYLVSVSAADTHKKHLQDAITVGNGLTATITSAGADERLNIALGTNVGGGFPCDGRLSVVSGAPDGSYGFTLSTTLYYTPFIGNRIALWTGSAWEIMTFSELSLSNTLLSGGTNYDVFAYKNGSVVALETLGWSGNTSRATALSYRDGILVLSSNNTRRYLGTVRPNDSNNFADNIDERLVFNAYNRLAKRMSVTIGGGYTYNSTTYQIANELVPPGYVVGLRNYYAQFTVQTTALASVHIRVGIGIDSSLTPVAKAEAQTGVSMKLPMTVIAYRSGVDIEGYHTFTMLESNGGAGTFSRDESLLEGMIWC